MTFTVTFTVALLTSYTYVYIHVSHVYKLACTLHRTINLLPLSALSSHIRQPSPNARVAEQNVDFPLPCIEVILTVTARLDLLLALVFPTLSTIKLCSDSPFTKSCNKGYVFSEICRSKRSHSYCTSPAYFVNSTAIGKEAQDHGQRLEAGAVQRNTSDANISAYKI
jgi:hypothetical protein